MVIHARAFCDTVGYSGSQCATAGIRRIVPSPAPGLDRDRFARPARAREDLASSRYKGLQRRQFQPACD
jgi:hypothetical protein